MKISEALNLLRSYDHAAVDPMMNPDLDGIAFAFAAGKLRRDEAIDAWMERGVGKYIAFRWLTLAEGL